MTATTAIPDDVPRVASQHAVPYKTDRHNGGVAHTYWLRNQLWKNVFLVVLRDRSDDGG